MRRISAGSFVLVAMACSVLAAGNLEDYGADRRGLAVTANTTLPSGTYYVLTFPDYDTRCLFFNISLPGYDSDLLRLNFYNSQDLMYHEDRLTVAAHAVRVNDTKCLPMYQGLFGQLEYIKVSPRIRGLSRAKSSTGNLTRTTAPAWTLE